MVPIAFFDSYDEAVQSDLTAYTDVYTLGRKTKNDGGGAHYKRYSAKPPYLAFRDGASPKTNWGLIPDGGTVNPLQAGGGGGGVSDLLALQDCINFIKWWSETMTATATPSPTGDIPSKDSNRSAIKLIIPANRTFVVNTGGSNPTGLRIRGPITIEGEDRFTSVIMMQEASVGTADGEGVDPNYADLFHAEDDDSTPGPILGITLRGSTMRGSYLGSQTPGLGGTPDPTQGSAYLFSFKNVRRLLFEDMVFERSRARAIVGGGVRGLTMRGCVLSQIRRGGMVINGAADIAIENNDFRWVLDDPIAITGCATNFTDLFYLRYGASIRIVGNRCLGCRGLNVVGAKNVLIEGNIHILGRGRAIHVGVVTDQQKGDTTTLNVIVRSNIVLDLLDAEVDPLFDGGTGGHRAIDIELLNGKPGTTPPPNFIPGLPDGTQTVTDPTRYYYTDGQGGALPTPHAAGLLVESNMVARTRPAAVGSGTGTNPDHVPGFDRFEDYGVGPYGGHDRDADVRIDGLAPDDDRCRSDAGDQVATAAGVGQRGAIGLSYSLPPASCPWR